MEDDTFQYTGINHVALVCRDMQETVEFYTQVLEMPLVKTIELPGGRGQHFFFDSGGGSTVAFFWFPDAPEAAPGIASMDRSPGASTATAHASMNHLAISIPLERFEDYVERLKGKGLETKVLYHNDGPEHATAHATESTWIKSVYFADPNGIWLELAAFTRPFDGRDVRHRPARHEERLRYLVLRSEGS